MCMKGSYPDALRIRTGAFGCAKWSRRSRNMGNSPPLCTGCEASSIHAVGLFEAVHAAVGQNLRLAHAWMRFPADARRFTPEEAARTLRIVAWLILVAAVTGWLNALRANEAGAAQALGLAAVGSMVGLVVAVAACGGGMVRLHATRR